MSTIQNMPAGGFRDKLMEQVCSSFDRMCATIPPNIGETTDHGKNAMGERRLGKTEAINISGADPTQNGPLLSSLE